MANNNQDWDDLGRKIEKIIDRAIYSHDYQELNQTIRQVVDRAVDVGGEAFRKAMDGSARTMPKAASTTYQEAKRTTVVEKKNLPALYGNPKGKTAVGIVKTVGGGLLSCFTLVGGVAAAVIDIVFASPGVMAVPMGLALAGMAAGGCLIYSGAKTLGKVSRFKTYRKTLGQKTHCTLERLAQSVGKSVKFVRKEVGQMIDEGLFLEGHMDREQTSLITSHETYRHYEQSRLMLEERQRQEAAVKAQEANAKMQETAKAKEAAARRVPQVQEVLERGNAFIAEIRRCNDAIPGEEISAKIYRMEMIVKKIFERAEAHPEIVPDLKKMMDYYLPMTVKLLNAYADMDAQPVQGETIQSSKREIEATLDTLNVAFEKLLDSVFQDTAMDVSSDITVLKTLLAQEGLTEDDLSKMKKQQNS